MKFGLLNNKVHYYAYNQILKMKILIFILLLVLRIQAQTYYINTNMTATQSFKLIEYNINFTSSHNVLAVQFKPIQNIFSNGITNVLMVVKFQSFSSAYATPQIISEFLQTSSSELKYMQPIDAIGGFTQVVNLPIPTAAYAADKIYLGFFDFDKPERNTSKTLYIRIDTLFGAKICLTCPQGTYLAIGFDYIYKCQCSPCRGDRVGNRCQYQLSDLDAGENSFFSIDNNNNRYLRIQIEDSTAKLNIYESSQTNSVKMYVQYDYDANHIAGKINSYYKNNKPLEFLITNNSGSIIQIDAFGRAALLTFVNHGSSVGTIYINYMNQSTILTRVYIVVIICSVIASILVAILIGILFRKWWLKRHGIAPTTISVNLPEQNPNILTEQQVNSFFPLMKAYFVIEKDKLFKEKSISNLQHIQSDSNVSQIFTEYECVICFELIKYMEDVRVAYCKHIFHDKCLISWFSKNFNCPICRKVFDYNSTKNMYKLIAKEKHLRGKDLGRAILGVSGPANKPKLLSQKEMQLKERQSDNQEGGSSEYNREQR